VHDNSLHQQEHLRFEDKMGAEPAHQALHVLHGPLNSFIDYIAMVSQGIQNFWHPILSPSILDDASIVSDEEYSPAASPSSLDHSLPTSTLRSTNIDNPPADTNPISGDNVQEDRQIETMHPGPISNKRKNPEGEEGRLFQSRRCKKLRKSLGDRLRQRTIEKEALKAAGFTDSGVVCMMGGVRLGCVEATRQIQDMVGHQYGVSMVCTVIREHDQLLIGLRIFLFKQRSFPVQSIDHPFLFELEVAKIQTLWHILQRNSREQLAGVLYDILAICFRKDYAVSHLFSMAFLEERHPELDSNYWELLQEPGPSGTTTYAEMLAGNGKRPAEQTTGNDNSSLDVEEMSLGYPPSEPGGEDDLLCGRLPRHEGRFRGNPQRVHCPDFVLHGLNMA
jgi:hypothetical protein